MAWPLPVKSRFVSKLKRVLNGGDGTGGAGKPITYTPSGGAPITVYAVIDVREQLDSRFFQDGEQQIQRATLLITNDALTAVATVDDDDKFNFDGFNWTPESWGRGQYGATRVEVWRNVAVTKENEETIERNI